MTEEQIKENYYLPVNGEKILLDKHNRPYYQHKEGKIMLTKKPKCNTYSPHL